MNIALYDNRPELWEYVDKNLEMMMYYVHPNGEVATEASGRQDQFQAGFMEHYYLPYKMAATRGKGNPKFWAMVSLIEKTVPEKLLTYLPYFMINPWISTDFHKKEGGTVPDNFVKEFRGSNLVRIRRGNIDATILGNNPTFLTLNKGNAVLASVRLASAFFGRGQFKSKILKGVEKQNKTGTYLLKEGTAKYSFENDTIEFGPGLAEHEWTAIRGGLPKPDGECVYIAGFTPFKHILKIG